MLSSSRQQILFLVCITSLLYLPSLTADFVFDDHYLIQNNPFLRSTSGIHVAFTQDYYGQVNPQYALGYYRPLSVLTHWMDWQVWGENAFGHHFTNLIIHICTVLLLFFLLDKLFEDSPLSFFAALIFALHPCHVSTVTFISGRVDALATFFSLLTLFLFMRQKALSPVSYFVALLCKEISVTTPALVFWKQKDQGWRSAFLWMIPFAVVLIMILILRKTILGSVSQNLPSITVNQVWNGLALIPAYLRFLVLPPFQLYLEPQLQNLNPIWSILSLVLFLAGLIFLKNRQIASWSAIWLITLLPVLGLIRIETSIDERFLYLPSVSFCLLTGAWLMQYLRARNKSSAVSQKQVLVVGLVVTLFYAPLLFVRQAYWNNDVALWASAVETTPESATVRFRLGVAYLQAGLVKEAAQEFMTGLNMNQDNKAITAALNAHLAITRQLLNQNQVEELYRKALQIDPNYFTAHFNLGLFYKQNHRDAEAIQELEAAIKCNPNSAAAHHNLAELLKQNGREAEAEQHEAKAEELGL
jgi:tetratricopeptide (TPR) repeat protein